MSFSSLGEGKQGRRYADTKMTAAYMGVSVPFLEKSRVTGIPKIPFCKVGRAVRYDLDLVDQFMAECVRTTTSEASEAA